MIGQIDGFHIAAQIRFVRQVHKGTILVVEGSSDARAFDRFINRSSCDLEVGFGKANVLKALDLLEEDGFAGVVAVVDADFDRITGTTYTLDNLCMTDAHDLDLTIFATSSLDRYLGEHGEPDLVKKHFNADLKAVRSKILETCLPFAYCRLVSEMHGLRLYFKDLEYDKFVNEENLKLDVDALISKLILRSSTSCGASKLKSFITSLEKKRGDPYQLVNGHDAAAILGIALRKMLGTRRVVHSWASEVEAGLRLAFDWVAFSRTALYESLRAWETNNKPYSIFSLQPG